MEYLYSFDHLINIYDSAMINQDIDELNKLYENNKPIHKSFYVFSIFNKLPIVLEWLNNKNCQICSEAINLAVRYGSKELVSWIINNGCEFDICTMSYSIESKNIEFIKWLLNLGCFWGILLNKHKNIIMSNIELKNFILSNNTSWNLH